MEAIATLETPAPPEPAPVEKLTRAQRIHPGQVVSREHAGRHYNVRLTGAQTIAAVLEDPAAWSGLVDARVPVSRGDRFDIVAPDGNTMADQCVVQRVDAAGVWLSRPIRLVALTPVSLDENALHRIVPFGARFAIEDKRNGVLTGQSWDNIEGARHALGALMGGVVRNVA